MQLSYPMPRKQRFFLPNIPMHIVQRGHSELTHWKTYQDRDHARADIFEYIEVFYNRQRLHQTLGYVSPTEYEMVAVA